MVFKEIVLKIKERPHKLGNDNGNNQNTRRRANVVNYLYAFNGLSAYYFRYSSYSEIVVNKLKTIDMDLFSVYTNINSNFQQ